MSLFDKLDAAMDAYEARKTADKQKADDRQAAGDRFLAEFSNFRELTAHPELERVGNHLHMRGHEFEVKEEEDKYGENSKRLKITLHVYPAGLGGKAGVSYGAPGGHHPQFSIMGDSSNRKVQFHGLITFPGGGSMMTTGLGECTLAEATAELVRTKAIDCIAKSFGGS